MSHAATKLRRGFRGLIALVPALAMVFAVTQWVLPAHAAPLSFTVAPQVPLPGQPATFTATDTRPMERVSWDFESDGTFDATGLTAQHVYATPGEKTVLMRATRGEEVKDVVKVIRVDAPPAPSFTATPGLVDPGQTVSFDASASSDPDGTIVKYEWDLDGNGTFETVTNGVPTTSKAYPEGGTVTVRLRVTDNDGATAVATSTVVVNSRPIARVSALPNPALAGQLVTFDAGASSDPDGTIVSYEWDLDDDSQFDDATGSTASRSFGAVGPHTVRVRVTDDRGSKDTASVVVTVTGSTSNQAPVASFSATPNPAPTGQTVQFNAGASFDPDGTITSYQWDLDGNGTYELSTGATPTTSKAYSDPGTVAVKLRVSDNQGAIAERTVSLVIENRRPVASFTASPNPALVSQSVQFNASGSSDPDGTITSYAWDLDNDGQFDDASGVSPSRSFAVAGTHTVRLSVTDNRGATDTATLPITVSNLPPPPVPNQAPVASFSATPNPAPTGQTVQFNAGASFDPDGTITSYQWDLDGNGTYELSTGATPTTSKAYSDPGTVVVKLRVTDNKGATAEKTVSLVIENRRPTASFTASPNPALVGQLVTLNASGSSDPDGTITSYAWDLDNDGQFDDAVGVSPSHSFAVAGTHTVRLSVTDNRGATDTATLAVTVNGAPVAPVDRAPLAGRLDSVLPAFTVIPPGPTMMTPFPIVRIVGRATSSGARIRLLMVRSAPSGATATVRCRGRRCPRRSQSKRIRSGSVRFRAFERRLRAGVRLQVFVTQPGRVGKYTAFTIRKRRPPRRSDMCATSIAARPGPCPSS